MADVLAALAAAVVVALVWVVVVGRQRIRESRRWRRATFMLVWVLSLCCAAIAGLLASFSTDAQVHSHFTDDEDLDDFGLTPNTIIIATETCLVELHGVEIAGPVYVGEPFQAIIDADARPLALPSSPDASPCGATVSLGTPSDGVVLVGGDAGRELHIDLGTETPTWSLTADDLSRHTVVAQVTLDARCTVSCRIPTTVSTSFTAARDPLAELAETALEDLMSEVEVEVTQPHPLPPDVTSTVDIVIRLPRDLYLGLLDTATISVQPEFEDQGQGSAPIPLDTDGSNPAQLTAHLIVTPTGPHDISLPVAIEVAGVRGEDEFVLSRAGALDIRVANASWMHRAIVNNLDWVATALSVAGVIGGFVVAGGRWMLARRRAHPAHDVTDARRYL